LWCIIVKMRKKYKCLECNKEFVSLPGFYKHINYVEKIKFSEYVSKFNLNWIKCGLCGKYVLNTVSLNKHLTQTHRNDIAIQEYAKKFKTEEWLRCDVCGAEFYRTINRQERYSNRHIIGGIFCGVQCANRHNLSLPSVKDKMRSVVGHLIAHNKELSKRGEWKKIAQKSAATRILTGVSKIAAKKAAHTRILRDPDAYYKQSIKSEITKRSNGFYERQKKNGRAIFEKCMNTWKKNYRQGQSRIEILFGWHLSNKNIGSLFNQVLLGKSGIEEFDQKFKSFEKSRTCDYLFELNNKYYLISVDGTKYHGLNYPIDEVVNINKIYYDTYYRDLYLNEYCSKHQINLIRFSDRELDRYFRNMFIGGNRKLLPYYVNGNSDDIDKFFVVLGGTGLYGTVDGFQHN
jgi:hypothetical protein